MPYSINCSTKILTLAIALFLLILIGVLWEFTMVPDVYILLSPQEEDGTDVHIQQHIHQKDLILCLPLYYHPKVIAEVEKTQARN